MKQGQIINFPTPETYFWFCKDSSNRLQVLIEALNLANDKGYLDKRTFQGLLDYCNIDIYEDLTMQDRAILNFHMVNYYNLDPII